MTFILARFDTCFTNEKRKISEAEMMALGKETSFDEVCHVPLEEA